MNVLPLRGALAPMTMPRVIPPSGLLTGLVSYWKMDEASGTRVDAHGPNSLTANNNPSNVAGKISNAATFVEASSQSLTKASFPNFHAGAWTWAGWLWTDDLFPSAKNYQFITLASSFFNVQGLGSGDKRLELRSWTGSGFNVVVASTFGNLSTGTWYFVCTRHDLANSTLKLSINLTENTTTYSTGPAGSSSTLALGGVAGTYVNGRLDEVGFWTRHLSDAEVSQLYGAGSPPAYPFS